MQWIGISGFVLIQLMDLANFLHEFEGCQNRMMGHSPFLSPLVKISLPELLSKLYKYNHRKQNPIFQIHKKNFRKSVVG
jgi:hypothetical protein